MARVKATRQNQQVVKKAAAAVRGGGDLLRATVVGVPAGAGRWLTLALVGGGRWRVPGCAREVPCARGAAGAAVARAWAEQLPIAERSALAARQAGEEEESAAAEGGGAWGEVVRAEARLAALRSAVAAAQAELGTLVLAATEGAAGRPVAQAELDTLASVYPPGPEQQQQQERVAEIDDRRA